MGTPVTMKEIEEQCKEIHLRDAKKYFETREFKKWVNECIDLARENNNLVL